jgi:hypothetical protein
MDPDLRDFVDSQRNAIAWHGKFPAFHVFKAAIGWDPSSTGAIDDSALVVVESIREPIEPADGVDWFDPRTNRQRLGPQILHVRGAKILPQNTPWPAQWGMVRNYFDATQRKSKAPVELVMDYTGLGNALAGFAYSVGLHPTKIQIHGGDKTTFDRIWRVPKSVLANLWSAHEQDGSLKFPVNVKNPDPVIVMLTQQLQTFIVTTTAAGSATYAAQGNLKDDLALALMYAIFVLSDKRESYHYSTSELMASFS